MLTFFYKTKTYLNFNYALCIVNYELFLGVPAKPSGFPLYLCSLRSRLAYSKYGLALRQAQ